MLEQNPTGKMAKKTGKADNPQFISFGPDEIAQSNRRVEVPQKVENSLAKSRETSVNQQGERMSAEYKSQPGLIAPNVFSHQKVYSQEQEKAEKKDISDGSVNVKII